MVEHKSGGDKISPTPENVAQQAHFDVPNAASNAEFFAAKPGSNAATMNKFEDNAPTFFDSSKSTPGEVAQPAAPPSTSGDAQPAKDSNTGVAGAKSQDSPITPTADGKQAQDTPGTGSTAAGGSGADTPTQHAQSDRIPSGTDTSSGVPSAGDNPVGPAKPGADKPTPAGTGDTGTIAPSASDNPPQGMIDKPAGGAPSGDAAAQAATHANPRVPSQNGIRHSHVARHQGQHIGFHKQATARPTTAGTATNEGSAQPASTPNDGPGGF